jgi:recombining binding protein (suppressor of hairless)
MTTVMCFHAAVAQKSYGSEKRFLCPPPLVQIESPVLAMRNQQLSMSIITDTHERTADQKATLDDNLKANFKYLHVGGGSVASTKSKSFYLALEITDPNARPPLSTPRLIQSDSSDGAPMPLPPLVPAPRPWAAFDSAPVTIISKPSKKTAKTRNIASCILAGGPVSLFNRINSQTVRTKYMTVEQGELAASNMSWSSFNVHVTRPVLDPSSSSSSSSAAALEQGPRLGPHPVQYGSEVILTDTITGVSSPPLWVRKVDKGIVIMEPGGPVSQMQKIALQRSTPPSEIGGRMYLSAGRQIFTSDTSASMEGKNGGPVGGGAVAPHTLQYQAPKTRIEIRGEERVAVEIDEVDDYLCWTIVGICEFSFFFIVAFLSFFRLNLHLTSAKFQYTFFDARSASPSIPPNPITPFPTLISQPVYRPATHTMELSVSHFAGSGLDVWLGNIGPLSQRVYHSAVEDANTHNSHTIVVVDLPALAEIVGVVQGTGVGSGKGKGKEREGYAATTQAATMDGVPPVNVGLLPILLVRASDGVGYHSGRSVACENIFAGVVGAGGGGEAWMEAANAVNGVEGGIAGWSLRIV